MWSTLLNHQIFLYQLQFWFWTLNWELVAWLSKSMTYTDMYFVCHCTMSCFFALLFAEINAEWIFIFECITFASLQTYDILECIIKLCQELDFDKEKNRKNKHTSDSSDHNDQENGKNFEIHFCLVFLDVINWQVLHWMSHSHINHLFIPSSYRIYLEYDLRIALN